VKSVMTLTCPPSVKLVVERLLLDDSQTEGVSVADVYVHIFSDGRDDDLPTGRDTG
jgi:hypothetical protein